MPKLGLIAGQGKLPILVAREASAQGWEVIAMAIEGDANELELKPYAKRIHWLRPEQVGKLIELLKMEGITDTVMAGKVPKKRLYGKLDIDARTLKIFMKIPNSADDTLLNAVAEELKSEGITLHPTTFCLNGVMAKEGIIVGPKPTEGQLKDVRIGWRVAKEIGRMDIGQTVVVKGGAVMAVEAIEGTDEAIRRGGALGGAGAVVVKVAKPQQDLRFDVPTVGLETIRSMKEVKASVLAIEANWTIFLEKEEVIEAAGDAQITIVAVSGTEMNTL